MIDAIVSAILFIIPIASLYLFSEKKIGFIPSFLIITFSFTMSLFMLSGRMYILAGIYINDTGKPEYVYIYNPFTTAYLYATIFNIICLVVDVLMKLGGREEYIGEV